MVSELKSFIDLKLVSLLDRYGNTSGYRLFKRKYFISLYAAYNIIEITEPNIKVTQISHIAIIKITKDIKNGNIILNAFFRMPCTIFGSMLRVSSLRFSSLGSDIFRYSGCGFNLLIIVKGLAFCQVFCSKISLPSLSTISIRTRHG